MLWRGRRGSSNIEDRRGMQSPGGRMRIPGGRPMRVGGGIGGLILLLALAFFGFDPSFLTQGTGPGAGLQPAPQQQMQRPSQADDEMGQFVSVVLAETETTWQAVFAEAGQRYEEPRLVLFSGSVSSACGLADAAVGPFYCPTDRKIYLDTAFFREMKSRFGASGDFAAAYVIAHEVGHHVQNILGVAPQVEDLQRRVGRTEASRPMLEAGDIDEALNAAHAIGDDRLQRRTQGYVVPDSFTHGTSEQRARWFRTGLETGELNACDTFNAERL
jgi:uncharacterized protein